MRSIGEQLRERFIPTDEQRERIAEVLKIARDCSALPENKRRAFVDGLFPDYISGFDIFTTTRFVMGTPDWEPLRSLCDVIVLPDPLRDNSDKHPIMTADGTIWPRDVIEENGGKRVQRGRKSWLAWPIVIDNEMRVPDAPYEGVDAL
jgi:hypothetical protein